MAQNLRQPRCVLRQSGAGPEFHEGLHGQVRPTIFRPLSATGSGKFLKGSQHLELGRGVGWQVPGHAADEKGLKLVFQFELQRFAHRIGFAKKFLRRLFGQHHLIGTGQGRSGIAVGPGERKHRPETGIHEIHLGHTYPLLVRTNGSPAPL